MDLGWWRVGVTVECPPVAQGVRGQMSAQQQQNIALIQLWSNDIIGITRLECPGLLLHL